MGSPVAPDRLVDPLELDLQLGECVAKLLRTGKLLEATGFAKRRDYFRERLGRSAKWVYGALKLARELAARPILRKAVQRGLVPTSKALAVMNVARDEAEAAWTIAAVHLTLDALAAKVRAGGHSPGFDEYQVDAFTMRMSEDDRKAVEMALELAGHIDGYDTEDWQRLEMMCMEFLGTFGKHGQWGPIVRVTEPLDVRPALERIDDRYALPESDLPDDPKALEAVSPPRRQVEGTMTRAEADALNVDPSVDGLARFLAVKDELDPTRYAEVSVERTGLVR